MADIHIHRSHGLGLAKARKTADLVPQFERLFAREGSDFPRFYAEVRRLAALPSGERRAGLAAAAASSPPP